MLPSAHRAAIPAASRLSLGSVSAAAALWLLFFAHHCAAQDVTPKDVATSQDVATPQDAATRQYIETPPGLITTDASFDHDTHEVVHDKSIDTYSLKDLETAKPGFINHLKPYTSPPNEYRMKPVRAIHARAVADMPVYDYVYERFISSFGTEETGAKGFTAAMDGVTTSSVEGAMYYVQTEVINQASRTVTTRCHRKNDIKFIVFYEVVIAQPNASLAMFQDDKFVDDSPSIHEYGPYVPFDHGRCTPTKSDQGEDVYPEECLLYNGNKGRPHVGPFVGAKKVNNDTRAPYTDAYWFSFPNSCPLEPWTVKTPACRASTRAGLCPPGKLPDGVACTYTHNILGFMPLDDLVGITSTTNEATGQKFADFAEYCRFGGIEFSAVPSFYVVIKSLPFWTYPQDTSANTVRTTRLINDYQALTTPMGRSAQIFERLRAKMKPLPTVAELTEQNPPCYENVKACMTAPFGCMRAGYSQICHPCVLDGLGCHKPPPTFSFPELSKPVGASTSSLLDAKEDEGNSDVSANSGEDDETTTETVSAAAHPVQIPSRAGSAAGALLVAGWLYAAH